MEINQNLYFLFFIIFFTELTPFQYIAVEKITREKVNIQLVDLRTPKYRSRIVKPRKGKGSYKRKKGYFNLAPIC